MEQAAWREDSQSLSLASRSILARVSSLLVRNATIVTMNDTCDVVEGGVSIREGRITAVGRIDPQVTHDRTIDAAGGVLLPGFVQTHVHLCQTLFRGYADDLTLLDWLRQRVWPMEAAHTPASLKASAELAACELLLSGTTAVLTMETVHDTDVVCETIGGCGLRATIGKCMMDAGDQAPPRLREKASQSLSESVALRKRWHGTAGGRLRTAYAPRFAVSCTRDLLGAVAAQSAEDDALVHTHASESSAEIDLVARSTGLSNLAHLADVGLASTRLCAAHCVWVDEAEQALIAERGVNVLHCPGSNLKLGSGLAPISELLARGASVSLGADGAACNNRLDMFEEMRLAALIQAVRKGPGVLTARQALWMATRQGAKAIGLERDIGSIEVGKRADMIVVDRSRPHLASAPDVFSMLAYAARGSDVRTTVVDGDVLVHDFELVRMDRQAVVAEGCRQAQRLARRAGIG